MKNASSCLAGLRVLDLTDESGQLAGRILADLGAEVIKLEPADGDPLRLRGPFLGGAADPDRGAVWVARNAGKKCLLLDLTKDRERFRDLVCQADVLIDTFTPGYLEGLGLGPNVLSETNPALVHCSVTPYGSDGPNGRLRGSDLTVCAASGNMFLTGDADRAPLRCSMPVTHYHGGAEAAAGILMALWARDRTGCAQHLDVSLQETMLLASMSQPAQSWISGYKGARSGAANRVGDVVMREIWPCKDGFVSFALRGGAARIPGLVAFVEYMHEHGMAPDSLRTRDWKSYNHNRLTQAEVDEIARPIAEFFLTKTMRELYDVACERNLLLAPANTERELLASRQLAARGYFTDLAGARVPARFANWERTRVRGDASALDRPSGGFSSSPRFGVRNEGNATPANRVASGDPLTGGIFAGLKVLEFGSGAAIPFATRYFADQGATVIKIESRQRPDFLRLLRDDGSGKVDESLFFNVVNCNKLSAGLNMKDPRAIGLAKRLIGWADVVVENFSPGVMHRWGLDYASIDEQFPHLVMVSTCLWGQTGPERAYPGFGGQGAALAGFNYLTGWPDREPLGPFGTITDSLSPRFAAVAIAAALLHRERTGEGSFIDLSQVEAGVYCLTDWLMAYQASGQSFGRVGNRSPHAAPHGVFPLLGDDRWLALAVHGDHEWERFKRVMGQPAWAAKSEYDELRGRLEDVEFIENRIAEWSKAQSPEEVVHELQAEGLDAALVENLSDLQSDPQLAHRGHFQRLTHAVMGDYVVEANGIRFASSPHRFTRPAPCLAADSEHVYCGILGMAKEEFDELSAAGVLG